MRRLFYWFLEAVSDDNVMRDGGDFRLLDRSILDQLREIEHAQPFVRVLTSSLAARQIGIPYDRQARTRERTKFPALRLVAFAFDGIFSHSTVPLRITTYIGILVFLISIVLAIFYLVDHMYFGMEWPSGWATITMLVLFGIGLNAIFLGILGEYVARIYRQVRPQPTTVVEKSINIL
jgi:dolichol-phosphate mannosyltransferase